MIFLLFSYNKQRFSIMMTTKSTNKLIEQPTNTRFSMISFVTYRNVRRIIIRIHKRLPLVHQIAAKYFNSESLLQ